MSPRRNIDVADALVAAAIAVVAILALWNAQQFSQFGSIFPRVAGGVMLLGSLALVCRALLGRGPAGPKRSSSGLPNSIALIVVLLVWILALEWAGFVLASWVAFVALALIAGGERPSLRRFALYAVLGVVLVVGLQTLFQQVLNVRLPAGQLLAAVTR
jgi:CDP-diglyceride synthetase